jgi:long-subunit fatty acid transport protein
LITLLKIASVDTLVDVRAQPRSQYNPQFNDDSPCAGCERARIVYDQTPVPNAESRTARLPDNNRRWLAFGGSYATSKSMTVDFGYAHLFVSDAPINRTSALRDNLVGTFKNQIDILSAQVGWNF